LIENVDFIKIKDYAVININNMFPVPEGNYIYVDISKEKIHIIEHFYKQNIVLSKQNKNILCEMQLLFISTK